MSKSAVDAVFNPHSRCCGVSSFVEAGCKVSFPPRDQYWRAVSGTNLARNHQIRGELCDILFGWHYEARETLLGVFEVKAKASSVGHIVRQLQGGARLLEDSLGHSFTGSFVAVLVHGGLRTIEVRQLHTEKVKFFGKRYNVHLKRCGERVSRKWAWTPPQISK